MRLFLTRQDVAIEIGVSVEAVRNNEKRWGLDKCKRQLNARVVHYLNPTAQKIVDRLKKPTLEQGVLAFGAESSENR